MIVLDVLSIIILLVFLICVFKEMLRFATGDDGDVIKFVIYTIVAAGFVWPIIIMAQRIFE